MRRMGRPRTKRKDLPTGLYFDPVHGTYSYRESTGSRQRKPLGKISLAAAINAYVRLRHKPAAVGTVGELIDHYVARELARLVRLNRLRPVTADEYRRLAAIARAEFGTKPYAPTAAESTRPEYLRKADIVSFLRRFDGVRGAVQANRVVAFVSIVFSNADAEGVCTYNPCLGAERNAEKARKNVLTDDVRTRIIAAGNLPLRLIAGLCDVTTMRKTDARLLLRAKVDNELIHIRQSKTGKEQEFVITPAVRGILDEAQALPGRSRSLYVFPSRKGTPYSESALQTFWRRAKVKAGLEHVDAVFRDLRTTEANAIKRAGGNAKEALGHASEQTTERHYLDVPTRVTPRR